MNICLGDQFEGSAVIFGPAGKENNELGSSDDLVKTGQRVAHVPGRAFINVCQHYHGVEPLASGSRHAIVVRGLSSAVRRSPAEIYYEQCHNELDSSGRRYGYDYHPQPEHQYWREEL